MNLVLRADSIGKSYGDRRVLTAATLRARPGEIGFLVGRNGSGKSTLLRIAAGAVTADHGTVTFKDTAYLRPRWHVLARQGLFYLSDRNILSPSRTPRQHLDAITAQFRAGTAFAAVEACELSAFLDRRCGALSSGERRRVEVAVAMARGPDCLLTDEPLRHVEPRDRAIIGSALQHVASRGCAVIITGHDVEDLFDIAGSVVWCNSGTTCELGAPSDAARNERFAAEYLGTARAARLAGEGGPSGAITM